MLNLKTDSFDEKGSFWNRFKELMVTLWGVFKNRVQATALHLYVKGVTDEQMKSSVDRFKTFLNDTNSSIANVSKSIELLKGFESSFVTEFMIKLLNGYRAKLVELQYTLANRLQNTFKSLLDEITSMGTAEDQLQVATVRA